MTQRKRGIDFSALGRNNKSSCKTEKSKIEIMIRGYQEMAEINLTISKRCFGVESEADGLYIRPTECE